ncbi:MAG: glycoside hydrolase family 13 protein [Chitinophagaceae bacterium]|nr:glycoside hydrolase family 13 protein [Chitinophagaceae bacterium]
MKKFLIAWCLLLIANLIYAQTDGYKCYPTSWWVGMKNPKLQLMLHGDAVANANGYTINYPGVKIEKINKVENENYVFLDLIISPAAKPGMVKVLVNRKGSPYNIAFELQARRKNENGRTRIQGVTSSDMIYFIMPDRFSNGDPSNDKIDGLQERIYSRDTGRGRHGGDLLGIEEHLDYIKDLGANTLWLTPVIINDMASASYHGYAFTDHYTIDPRFGGEKAYHKLIEAAHKKGLKIIQDAVYNHVGINHITVKDPPMKDWLNQWPSFQNTSYKDQTLMDPYASAMDKKIMTDGWFEPRMPDLNQRNPYVANYLIQHAIWTTENFGIDGWRIDTYAYCDRDFMNKCNQALLDEYPQIGIFAETWVHGIVNQSFFTRNIFDMPGKSNLPGVTDFQVHFAMDDALTQKFGWMEGLSSLYSTLANDFVYKDAYKNCIFLDNHDMERFYTTIGQDINKYKMGINWLLTLRGIPELYYGTEILMTGSTNPSDADVRKDFPGGWAGDTANKFTAAGRSKNENEAFDYVRTLSNFRKNSSAIKTGRLMQFVPYNGIYVYFRYDAHQTVMVVSNTNDKPVDIKMERFKERTSGFTKMKNIFSATISPLQDFTVAEKGSGVFEMEK